MKRKAIAKQYYYVLVFTDKGPKFVTKVNEKTCEFADIGKPCEVGSLDEAQYIAATMTLYGHHAVPVGVKYEYETQPYRYDAGHFEWVMNKKEEEAK